eukprot:TRINITY_DN102043_c0_g1_i1.p1 TRINITY_DN102043_c0_g1~~TRINITY_DN102043_c0_g1_i1.p1  ORF type:complete len:109 (-),score=16.11 TRINITY_DN102043_c0_g1_i1:124-450(-)
MVLWQHMWVTTLKLKNSLNMNNAADSFVDAWHDSAGLATCWPSMPAAASTWDVDIVHALSALAEGIGEELKGKGANTVLGPSINVHRVALDGRNFEYPSGENSHLGAH